MNAFDKFFKAVGMKKVSVINRVYKAIAFSQDDNFGDYINSKFQKRIVVASLDPSNGASLLKSILEKNATLESYFLLNRTLTGGKIAPWS